MTRRPSFGGVVALERVADQADRDDARSSRRPRAPSLKADDDARRQRQLRAEAGEQLGERRDDLPQDRADDDRGDHDDGDRIDHRRLDLPLQLDGLLDVDRQPLEDRVEDAARLAGGDHVRVERVEGLRVLLHRVGERGAGFDVLAHLQDHRREALVRLLLAEDVEALHQRQPGVDHDRELAGEDRQVLRRDACTPPLAAFFAAAAALPPSPASIAVTMICSRRSAATAASMVSATRSPRDRLPAAGPSGYANVGMAVLSGLPDHGPVAACPGRLHPGAGHDPGAAGDHLLELVLHRRGVHRRLQRDQPPLVQRRQRLVHRLHPELLLAGLHRRVDLVDLVLADQVPDRRRWAP